MMTNKLGIESNIESLLKFQWLNWNNYVFDNEIEYYQVIWPF